MGAAMKLLCFLVVLLLSGCNDPQGACVFSRGFCRTSFVALIAYRENLIGKEVSFEGVPRKKGGVYYVYMDSEAAQYHDQTAAIELQTDGIGGAEAGLDFLEFKRSSFRGVLSRSSGNAWAKLKLVKVPMQALMKVEGPPPPPPPVP